MFWACLWCFLAFIFLVLWIRKCAECNRYQALANEADTVRKKQKEQYQMELNAAILKADRVNSIHVLGVEIEPADEADDIERKKEQAINEYLQERGYLPEVIN
jgi:hypothetical protein